MHLSFQIGGVCPLLVATERNNLPIVQLCIESSRANLNITDNNGKTALILAAERGYVEIVKALLQKDLKNQLILDCKM